MKIQSSPNQFAYAPAVREKQDGESSSRGESHSQNPENKHQDKFNDVLEAVEGQELSVDALKNAVDAFHDDALAQSNGLSASVAGSGPGLKVVLTDNSGSIVRELSGEEFLKLKQTVAQEGKPHGKILDLKS